MATAQNEMALTLTEIIDVLRSYDELPNDDTEMRLLLEKHIAGRRAAGFVCGHMYRHQALGI